MSAFSRTVFWLAAALSGCALEAYGPGRPMDESADFSPVDYRSVCLLENEAVESPGLPEAIEAGFLKSGARVRRLRAGEGPGVCDFVVTYAVDTARGRIRTIVYQTYEHGIPRVEARGKAPPGRFLTAESVRAYSAELMERLAPKKADSR